MTCHMCRGQLGEHFVTTPNLLNWCVDLPLCKFRSRARLGVRKLRALDLLREERAQERQRYRKVIWSSPWKVFASEQRNMATGCERCGAPDPAQVHHLHYGTLGRERPQDVLIVCRGCHSSLDVERRKGRLPSVQITVGEAKRVVTWTGK